MLKTYDSGVLHVSPQGRELTAHGTALFPVGIYYDDLSVIEVPWHWHDEYEAVIIEKGETTVAAGVEKYVLKAGQGFFVNAGVLHGCWQRGAGQCLYHSLVFHPRLIGGGIDSVFWQKYLRPLSGSPLKGIALDGTAEWHAPALAAIEAAWQAGAVAAPGYEFRMRAELSELVFQLCAHLPAGRSRVSEKAQREGERIKLMLRCIEERYGEELSTADIAASAMVSESECLRCFRNTIGMPPIKYLKQYRVEKAAELLGSTDEKIAEIGAMCGFQDTSYFTKTFRELKGVTPGEYRRQQA